MIKTYSTLLLALLCAVFYGHGQLNITSTSTNYSINFSNTVSGVSKGLFNGSGFQNNPFNGRLDADGWATTGFSDGDKAFGIENTSGDHARGSNPSDTGGLYGVDIGGGNQALIIRSSSGDWTPGTLSLLVKNDTGVTINELTISYKIVVNNDNPRSNSFNFSHSNDNTTYTSAPSLNYVSNEAADTNGYVVINRNITISGLSINNGSNYYLRWSGDDVSGSGSRDLIGLDDITISGISLGAIPELQLADISGNNQSCGYVLNYGNVASNGSTSDRSFNIQNIGSADLNILSLDLTGDFTIVSPTAPFSITPNSSQTFIVQFTPTGNGTRLGVLTINNNDSDEFACKVNLTGSGYTPAPEINVEANSGSFPNIPDGDTSPQGIDNTLFAATLIGSSRVKSYRIQNLGTDNLIINAITTTGVNPSDFIVDSSLIFPITITPGNLITFDMTFTPSAAGQRDATVEIINNDADENPYNFAIRGNGNCTASGSTITPSSGPVGTVTLITGSNFGSLTTATINNNPVAVNVLSNTQLSITIPEGASTGNIIVKNSLGCFSTLAFTLISKQISTCEGNTGLIPTDLFISEVTDKGTGSHSYIEIYNGTGSAINLTAGNYQIRIHNNGKPLATASVNLTGALANDATVLVAIGGTDSTSPEGGHTASFFSNTGGINDDDHIRLYKGSTWIDLWGDPSGSSFTVAPKDYTYRRKNSGIVVPSTTWNVADWESFTPVDYTDIGLFDFLTGSPPNIITQPNITSTDCIESAILSVTAEEGFIGSKPLTYQWYASAPGNIGWTALSDNLTYTGTTSSQLHILTTEGLNNYQYYARIKENDVTCYIASKAITLFVDYTIWNGVEWSQGIPNINRIAIINADYDTSMGSSQTSFSACGLRVNSNSELIIANDTYIEIANNITIDGQVIVHPTGAVVQISNSGLVNGAVLTDASKIVVEKETAEINAWYEYTYWSSPVAGATIGTALFQSKPNRRFWFNATNYQDSTKETNNNNATEPGQDGIDDDGNDWVLATSTDVMKPGMGYAATHSQIAFIAAGLRYKYLFEGPFNNGIITPPVLRNDIEMNDLNLNFIGNPYPSAIDADRFFGVNMYSSSNTSGTLEGLIYFWSQNTAPSCTANGNEKLNFADSDYAIINGSGETAGGDGLTPSRNIPSGQGFFVAFSDEYATTSGNVVFNNSMRTRDTGANSQFFRKSNSKVLEQEEPNKLWVNLSSDNGVFNQICVSYINGASDAKDPLYYDAPRDVPSKTGAILYSRIEADPSIKLAIQGKDPESLNVNEIISLGFYTSIEVPTIYTLTIADLQGDFLNENNILLLDKDMNKIHNLSEKQYLFTSSTGEFNERFELFFNQETLSNTALEAQNSDLKILELADGKVQFSIDAPMMLAKVELFDLIGRRLYSFDGSNSREVFQLKMLSQSAYIAKATLSNGQILIKKAIKRL